VTEEEFVRLVGEEVLHKSPGVNLPCIRRHGLLSAHALASLAGVNTDQLLMRRDRTVLQIGRYRAILNDQKPLRAGRNKSFLADCTIEDWSAQLDQRVFFWPSGSGGDFDRRLGTETVDIATLRLSARGLYQTYSDQLFVAPINTGNATRRPTPRGADIYANVAHTSLASYRKRRGKTDIAREISLVGEIPADRLSQLLL
jgi:hypothetical protein